MIRFSGDKFHRFKTGCGIGALARIRNRTAISRARQHAGLSVGGLSCPLEQVERFVAGALAAQAVEAGVGDHLAGPEDFGDGRAAMLGPRDADRGVAVRAALVPASGRRGLGGVGAEVDRGGDLRALRASAGIAEVFLAVNPHLGALLRVAARHSREGLRQGEVQGGMKNPAAPAAAETDAGRCKPGPGFLRGERG